MNIGIGILVPVLLSFFTWGCNRKCDFLSSGRVINGMFLHEELHWSMELPDSVVEVDSSEYLRVAGLGLEYMYGSEAEHSCSQSLGRWELLGERYRACCFVSADPVSADSSDIDLIALMRDTYRTICQEEGADYYDSVYVKSVSGLIWEGLYSSFTRDKTLHSFIYTTRYADHVLIVYIVGTDYPAVLNWCRLFEASSFGEENIVAFQQRDTTGS